MLIWSEKLFLLQRWWTATWMKTAWMIVLLGWTSIMSRSLITIMTKFHHQRFPLSQTGLQSQNIFIYRYTYLLTYHLLFFLLLIRGEESSLADNNGLILPSSESTASSASVVTCSSSSPGQQQALVRCRRSDGGKKKKKKNHRPRSNQKKKDNQSRQQLSRTKGFYIYR